MREKEQMSCQMVMNSFYKNLNVVTKNIAKTLFNPQVWAIFLFYFLTIVIVSDFVFALAFGV